MKGKKVKPILMHEVAAAAAAEVVAVRRQIQCAQVCMYSVISLVKNRI